MESRLPPAQMSESFRIGALLALAGGFFDVYTYLCRGGVFANAQTGNMVLLGIAIAGGDWAHALHYIFPIAAFALGVAAAEWTKPFAFTGGSSWCWPKSCWSQRWPSCRRPRIRS